MRLLDCPTATVKTHMEGALVVGGQYRALAGSGIGAAQQQLRAQGAAPPSHSRRRVPAKHDRGVIC